MKKTKPEVPFQARQGDVFIERIENILANAKVVPRDNGKVILAYGEVTGHSHAIASPKTRLLRTADQATFLEVKEAMAMLDHDEHATIPLPQGKYRVRKQREYKPEGFRNVQD